MTIRKMLLGTIVAILITSPATAGTALAFSTGNDWTADCTSKADWRHLSCIMYARGLADGLSIWQYVSPETAKACIDDKVEAKQLVDVGLAYIKDHPATRAEAAGKLLTLAFVDAWRCGDDNEKPG